MWYEVLLALVCATRYEVQADRNAAWHLPTISWVYFHGRFCWASLSARTLTVRHLFETQALC